MMQNSFDENTQILFQNSSRPGLEPATFGFKVFGLKALMRHFLVPYQNWRYFAPKFLGKIAGNILHHKESTLGFLLQVQNSLIWS